ncbi:Uncharacterized protein Adt_33593 [Abeliophyllum distichum]|uniref:Uncharacterized protein n=1 Tax=Abeliophyllum distichum TaxID=126358 RepID=A0ABD1QWN6_9LAMI
MSSDWQSATRRGGRRTEAVQRKCKKVVGAADGGRFLCSQSQARSKRQAVGDSAAWGWGPSLQSSDRRRQRQGSRRRQRRRRTLFSLHTSQTVGALEFGFGLFETKPKT